MGDDYQHYTPGGGVECYVLDSQPRPGWLPDYHASHVVYWLEKHSFFPLRKGNAAIARLSRFIGTWLRIS